MAKTLFEWKGEIKKKALNAPQGKWLFKDMPMGPLSPTGPKFTQGKVKAARPGTEGGCLGPGN